MRKTFFQSISITLALLIGIGIGITIQFLNDDTSTKDGDVYTFRSGAGSTFTNPLIECDSYNRNKLTGLSELEVNLEKYREERIKSKEISEIAIYFRELNNGKWIGLNEDVDFSPASLTKLSIALTYMKMAEADPSIMQKELLFDPETLYSTVDISTRGSQYYKPGKTIEAGQAYTIEDLLKYTLQYSDNSAQDLLVMNVDADILAQTLSRLDLYHSNDTPHLTMSVKEYGSIFRILYNATFLSQANSEFILSILAESTFSKGIKAGVPKDLLISSKFGEKGTVIYKDDENLVGSVSDLQLHDCGIVYLPENPYLLCIMSRGKLYSELEDVISTVSEIVYKEVTKGK